MSRRAPNPAAERAAQNTQTIKNLLKLEGNKTCADCKRNKHPRWASWNLGIFICIRCSGIHRGMGTHISRVKSVDLDAWTDEQLQSVLKWGNSRANKYWEAKLAPGHVPSEAKIENFIRTKYESKRWVMEGPIPDPSTLDAEGDDDVPLSLVKEKHNIERSTSQRASASPAAGPSQIRRAPQQDIFAGEASLTPRASASASIRSQLTQKSEPAPPKQTKPADSLLGLDFFGDQASPPNQPSSAAATPGTQSRPDLKQSILSLYASRPPQQQQVSHTASGAFGIQHSPPLNPQHSPRQPSFGGMNDAFGSMSFTNTASAPLHTQAKPNAFSNLGNISGHRSTPSQSSPPANLGIGSFFDAKPVQRPIQPAPQPSRTLSSSSGFGAFDSAPGISPAPLSNTTSSSGLGDLFDFSTPAPQPPPKQIEASPATQQPSVFHLSQPSIKPSPHPLASSAGWGNNDAWSSNDAWGATTTSPTIISKPPSSQASVGEFGWGPGESLASQSIVPGSGGRFATGSRPVPKVSADEDFGGWSSAAPVTSATGPRPAKSTGGFGATEDLFSNVWE